MDQRVASKPKGAREESTPLPRPADGLVPLVVDLDGTLVPTDLLLESIFILARRRPFDLVKLPFWLARGRAEFKRRVASVARPDPRTLPYDRAVIDYLEAEKRDGRRLILATAADTTVANEIAHEVGLFDKVYASDGVTNLSGVSKRERLVAEFGVGGFDYVGNSRCDLPVWDAAHRAVLVRPSVRLRKAASRTGEVARIFEHGDGGGAFWRALRAEHWSKNALVFVPLLAAHRLYELSAFLEASAVFVMFCLCASAVYLLNDLLDLQHDRLHPRKKERPLASGRLPIARALAAIPLLATAAIAMAMWQPPAVLSILGAYGAIMLAYCLKLRDLAVVDVVALTAGYTLRVMAGAAAIGLAATPSQLGACALFFFGLALLKRYAELVTMRSVNGDGARARSYLARHSGYMALVGCASGYLAVTIFALQVDFERRASPRDGLFWITCVLLLYWIAHMWLMARRGQIVDDPVSFTLTDRTSQIVAVLVAVIALVGA